MLKWVLLNQSVSDYWRYGSANRKISIQPYTIIDFVEVDIRVYQPENVIFTEAEGRGE